MVNVGIIDSDASARNNTVTHLLADHIGREKRPIHILFEVERATLVPDAMPHSPDVVLIDIARQDPRTIEKVKRQFPDAEVIVLTNIYDVKTVRACFRGGAVSYLIKETCLSYLHFTISISLNNGSFISPRINRALIDQTYLTKKYEDMLTARELQIANGIAEGLSYKMIADQYHISLDTVRIYIKRVYRKLNINSKGELMAQFSI